MVATVSINYWAVLVAAIVSYAVGALWYSALFGKKWAQLQNMTPEKMEEMKKKGVTKSYIGVGITALIMAYVLAHFVDYTEATTFTAGMTTGF